MNFDILILGPVELRVNGHREMYGSAKDSQMLAVLALNAGKAVPLDTLAQRLWDDAPPGKPRASLHSYAARIRRKLGAGRLPQQAHAYVLDIDPDTVDYLRFQRLIAQARSLVSSGDDTQALALLHRAEALWRGEPLTGFTSLWAERIRRGLAERRLAAALLRIGIELRLGRFTELAGELSSLVEQYPTDETVVRHFMTAAYGCGRQADALRAYESIRRLLRDQGTEPGEALSRTHGRILDRAPLDDLLTDRVPGTRPVAPNNLPAHGELVGRTKELRALQYPLSGVVALQAISGMAGVGKSLLALHTARRLARHYPAGQFYLNLRAHAPGQHPLPSHTALTILLRHFGIPAAAIPHDAEELAALWRTTLSTRRAIIVLDDAVDAAQIGPLLPGGSPSLILVTSRRRLSGLPGIRHLFLDVLSTHDAVALFTGLVGPERAADPAEVAVLARMCDHLPLALELTAGRLISRPAWTVSHLIQRMSRDPGRLAEIRDGHAEIQSAFALSYNTLPGDQQKAFRLLSLHLAPEFGPHATAALVDLPLEAAERILEALLDSHLLQEITPERYKCHDLIAEYALSLTTAQDPEADREAALGRLALFYLHAATEANRLLNPRRPQPSQVSEPPAPPLPLWPDPQAARAWLTSEHAALTAAERHLRSRARPGRAAHLADALAGFLDSEGYWEEAEEIHSHAARHWHSAGDQAREARSLIDLAVVRSQMGRYEQAEEIGRRALAIARAVGDTATEAESLRALGLLCWNHGRLNESLTLQQEALSLRMKNGDLWQIARGQNNLGISLLHVGDHEGAMKMFQAAFSGFASAKDERGKAQALNNRGDLHLHMGETDSAHRSFVRALEIFLEVGSRSEQAITQLNVGNTLPIPEKLNQALTLHRTALHTFRGISDKRNETITLNAIGTALYKAGQYMEASAHHTAALNLAQGIGTALEQIQALRGLGMAEFRSGHRSAASAHLTAALALAQRINAAEEEARSRTSLAELRLATTGRTTEALTHLEKALAIFQRLNKFESERIEAELSRIRGTGLRE
ncbi:AfsR/SARP family transcriptional regulator [Streptomyces sp. NBC_01429]|uniref:AfsR/SARP family transcriptional regulator n=1 Tax=Streptomyces sp. NBC_01429 TaxID=2903862 RepID=UPI002E2883D6|nr:tetratricopeptide repeat protein [Streptomyces sp. NBC_01429]